MSFYCASKVLMAAFRGIRHLRNIAMRDYQESVTTRQTHGPMDRPTPDKVIPMCRYASQGTQTYETE